MSSSSYISHSAVPSGPGSSTSATTRDSNNNSMDGDNLLKLALKKPKSWKWELTTSSSSPSISFPKIQLFDSRTGELMVQVDKPDCVVKSEELIGSGDGSERSRSSQERKGRDQRYRRSRSTCIREKVTTSSDYLSDVFAQLQNKGLGHKLATSVTQYRVEETEEEIDTGGYGLQKSQSAREIRRSASVEQKRKILKSPSSRSGSMLGRISECYKSSTEEEPPRQPEAPPAPAPAPMIPEISEVVEEPQPKPTPEEENKNKIYKLVRSNVGTLIVREESFHTQRSLRRRKQQLQEQSTIPEGEPQVDKRITISDIPDSSYNDTIRDIDSLISKVMLSHNLQDVHESRSTQSRGRSSTQQNGEVESVRKRRARRSASAGSNASSCGSGSRRGRNSPLVTVPTGSSSSDEDLVSLAESRFGSLKRRGRAKYKRNSTGQVHEVYSGLVNGVSRQHETNVRRSTTVSSNNSTTVEIEECESVSLSSFQSNSAPGSQQTTIVSEKSSSTSLSTLSPPSPAAETCGEVSSSRWGTRPCKAETAVRDWERVREQATTKVSSVRKDDVETKIDCLEVECVDAMTVDESKSQLHSRGMESNDDEKMTATEAVVAASIEESVDETVINQVNECRYDNLETANADTKTPELILNGINEVSNGCDDTNDKSRDQERPQNNAVTVELQNLNFTRLDESKSTSSFQRNSAKDCISSKYEENLNVTSRDVSRRSPTNIPRFGSFKFPRHIDGSNVSSASLAWSYLPQLTTSHSTSSLSSLRSNSASTSTQSPVQRRQLKSYAQRHHRSSFHVVPN